MGSVAIPSGGGGKEKIRVQGYSGAIGYKKADGSVLWNMKKTKFDNTYEVASDGTITLISGSNSGSNYGMDANVNVYGVYGSHYEITSITVVK